MEREDHGGDMNHWIVKTEPSTYSYDDLARQKTAVWDGVKNNLALKHLREMQPGDRVLVDAVDGELVFSKAPAAAPAAAA